MEQMPAPHALENKETVLTNALEIVRKMEESHADLVAQVKELISNNDNLRRAMHNYDSVEDLFGDFKAQVEGTSFGGAFRVASSYDTTLEGALAFRKEKTISLVEVEKVSEAFEERKAAIIEGLSAPFADKNEAVSEIETIQKKFIFPILNQEAIVS